MHVGKLKQFDLVRSESMNCESGEDDWSILNCIMQCHLVKKMRDEL